MSYTYDDLTAAVLEQLGGDDEETRASLIEAGEHGADAGWAGFTYTPDLIAFYDRHVDLLWYLLAEEVEDTGSAASVPEYVGQFNTKAHNEDDFKTVIAWWALETAGRRAADAAEAL